MMRSPGAAFDLRGVLVAELRTAAEIFENGPTDPKTLSRVRRALRRARAIAKVGGISAPGLAEVFEDAARAITRVLGQACANWRLEREARTLAARVAKKNRRELEAFADRIQSLQRTPAPLNAETIRAGLKDLLAIAQVWPDTSLRQVERGLVHVRRRARKAWRRARHDANIAARDDWRKSERDRRAAIDLLGALWCERRPKRRKTASALGAALRRERAARRVLERLVTDRPVDAQTRVLDCVDTIVATLSARANKLGRRLHADDA